MADKDVPEPTIQPVVYQPHLTTPAMDRAVELARELLRQRGFSEEEIDGELHKPPGSGVASF